MGEGDYASANDIFSKSLACALFFALVTAALGLLFLDSLIPALGTTAELTDLVNTYLTIILGFSPVFLLGFTLFLE